MKRKTRTRAKKKSKRKTRPPDPRLSTRRTRLSVSASEGSVYRLRRVAECEGMTLTELVWTIVYPKLFQMEKHHGL